MAKRLSEDAVSDDEVRIIITNLNQQAIDLECKAKEIRARAKILEDQLTHKVVG